MALPVLNQLLDGRQAEDDAERDQGDEATRRRDICDLLKQADEKEVDVGPAPPELLPKKLGQEGEEVVLGGGDSVRAKLVFLGHIDEDPSSLWIIGVTVRLPVFLESHIVVSAQGGHFLEMKIMVEPQLVS